MGGLNNRTGLARAGPGAVTLFEGSSFCLSGRDGDMDPNRAHGVFYEDTRIISGWRLLLDGHVVEPLGVMTPEPYWAVFLGRQAQHNGRSETDLILERDRRVGTGLREDLVLRNYGRALVECVLTVRISSDFADLFEVKRGRIRRHWDRSARVDGDRLVLESQWRGQRRGLVLQAENAELDLSGATFRVTIPPFGTWSGSIVVQPVVDGEPVPTNFPVGKPLDQSEPSRRHRAWLEGGPVALADDESLEQVLRQSQSDLGALRIFDPEHPDRAVVAAGAPWYMALFGRDSLLTSFMALPIDQSLALGTLQTLAKYQGREIDPRTEEQPGRIMHEVRLGVDSALALGGGGVYYGTNDATPLFVMLVGELCRWGFTPAQLDPLMPHVDRALDWVERFGDRDGDGFVEYQRLSNDGLLNQGWKDSWDGINFADGTLATPPIALCEVQGYVYAAYVARALLAREAGDDASAQRWRDRAAKLKEEFNRRFWLPDRGYFAVALDADKRAVDSCTSNMGHCLWTGIVDDDKAAAVAERLLSRQMFTGWGVRTLAEDMGAYNPVSYHNGSVWPHDSALVAAGLMRYGFVEEAQRIATGLLDAAGYFGGRLPELFCGFDRGHYPEPIRYPTSCSPQAWATAAPIQLIRTLLRYEPCLPNREVWFAPTLPAGFGRLRLDNIPLGNARLTLNVTPDGARVDGLPAGVTLIREPQAPAGGLDPWFRDERLRPARRPDNNRE
ncbi:MAG TPA: glycogen debranching N-terminal domain-containing protein [Pengzhenrongella sp.]